MMPLDHTTHIMIDIEALGRRPGCAVIEFAAVAFCPETGRIGQVFDALIRPGMPFTAEIETLAWHLDKGTWPRPESKDISARPIDEVLHDFKSWANDLGTVEAFWSWGSTYDFPILTHAFDVMGTDGPWEYYQCRCARTVWNCVFPGQRPAPRPHSALADAVAAAHDLMAALSRVNLQEAPEVASV